MLKLNSIKSDKIWGHELWIASTHQNGCQKEFMDFCGGLYPLLIKIIQANDKLSVQVHPNDELALKLEGPGNVGKTECWYVLDAEPDSKLVYGIKKDASREELEKAINENRLESYLEYANVKKGDFIFIPAGTVHAIGGGLRLLEVQQSCDLTYRLYDWGRGREVHVQKSLDVISKKPLEKIKPFEKEFSCEYFSLEKIDIKGGWSMMCPKPESSDDKKKANAVQLIFVLESNKAVIRNAGEPFGKPIAAEEIYAIAPGEKITIEGNASVMKILNRTNS